MTAPAPDLAPTRAYRLVVESWPTPDGEPWQRTYGLTGNDGPIPEWLSGYVETILRTPWQERDWRLYDRIKEDVDRDTMGVLMPVPRRKVMLSASGTHSLARHMRAFGAVVHVHRSRPIDWSDDDKA